MELGNYWWDFVDCESMAGGDRFPVLWLWEFLLFGLKFTYVRFDVADSWFRDGFGDGDFFCSVCFCFAFVGGRCPLSVLWYFEFFIINCPMSTPSKRNRVLRVFILRLQTKKEGENSYAFLSFFFRILSCLFFVDWWVGPLESYGSTLMVFASWAFLI